MKRPPFLISIQSQVVLGHVGNSAALFPMQAAGLEVAAIPTVVFSNANPPAARPIHDTVGVAEQRWRRRGMSFARGRET